jgi:hypothetical protein
MNKSLIISIVTIISAVDALGALTFTGLANKPVAVQPESSTGLNEIYVIETAAGVRIEYQASSGNVVWSRYSTLGGGYAETITNVTKNGNTYSIAASSSDMGYIIEDGDRRYYYWVVNYANHELTLDGLNVAAENDCNRTTLEPIGNGDKISYYTINGQARELSRQLKVSYQTLEYDEDSQVWNSIPTETEESSFSSVITVNAPLCNTEFTLTGDRFLQAWGRELSVTSETFSTNAVSATRKSKTRRHSAALLRAKLHSQPYPPMLQFTTNGNFHRHQILKIYSIDTPITYSLTHSTIKAQHTCDILPETMPEPVFTKVMCTASLSAFQVWNVQTLFHRTTKMV